VSTDGTRVEIELVTDPIDDSETEAVIRRLPGWTGFAGSPTVDGTPRFSRSRFVLASSELAAGGLDARLDVLDRYGISVHRVLGEHRAVRRANRRYGYETGLGSATSQTARSSV
jgi:hypothetical protein